MCVCIYRYIDIDNRNGSGGIFTFKTKIVYLKLHENCFLSVFLVLIIDT